MQQPSILKHIRDIGILPFTVTVIVPYFYYDNWQEVIPDTAGTKIVGLICFLFGAVLFFYTVFLFYKIGKGTLAPWSPTQKLLVTGPYQYCRNPMITGVFFILIGETLFLHSIGIFIWACLFFVLNTVYFILSEEPGLQERFGNEYKEYKTNVPRWIPRLTPYKSLI